MNCPHCGLESGPGSLYCASCGNPLSEACPVPAVSSDNPFHRIRTRSLALWAPAGVLIVVVVFIMANLFFGSGGEGLDPFFDSLIISAGFYGLMAAWVLAKAFGNGVDLRLLVGGVPSGCWWRSVVGVVGLLMLFTIFTSWLFLYLVAEHLPQLVDFFTSEDVFVTGEGSDYAGSYNVQTLIAVVFVAPVVEELFFRGMLLTRWSLKWGPTAGIIASSALFGLFHVGFFGAFAFGVAMSLLYIQTKTLLVPIAAHFLNNLVAAGFSAIALRAEARGGTPDVRDLEAWLPTFVAGTAITLSLLLWYIVRNWPRHGQTAPYLTNQALGE